MGNSLGGKRRAKVMKINGETFKLKTPVQARSVLESHPGHVLLESESESVRHHGARAKPLEPHHELKPKRLYFLVQLPKFPEDKSVRRVRSGIHMSAKDRLDSLMLARRSASDLSTVKPVRFEIEEERKGILETRGGGGGGGGGVRVTMRLPKSEVERLMAESKDGAEAAEKIVSLCMAAGGGGAAEMNAEECKRGPKLREKRVGFLPINEGDIHLAVAS